MAEARLVPFEDNIFDCFIEAFTEKSSIPFDPSDTERRNSLKAIFIDENAIMRGMVDAETGEFVGYCEIKDTRKDDWEIGVAVLERYWRRGYGYSGIRSLLEEVFQEYDRREFIAKIVPDNEASVRLFQKLGATPRGIVRSIIMPDDESMRKFQRENPGLVNEFVEEMAGLFGVEPIELVGRTLVFDVRYDGRS